MPGITAGNACRRRRSSRSKWDPPRPRCASLGLLGVVLLILCGRGTSSGAKGISGRDAPSPTSGGKRQIFTTESWEAIIEGVQKLRYPNDDEYSKSFQERIPESAPFPCRSRPPSAAARERAGERWRSEERPEEVHRLRPGDVDVVAAMGDSITCANGAREFTPQASFVQDRGVSFTGGGLGTWREILTLPNLLKVYNPNLVGYAVGRGDFLSHNAQLNVAIPASLDDDMLTQAKLLVRKMRNHPRINYDSDWKLLSVFIGHNDVCSAHCFDTKKHSPEEHAKQLRKALDYLYQNVPRLFVNVISILDPTVSTRIHSSWICSLIRRVACPCLYIDTESNLEMNAVKMSRLVRRYQHAERQLVTSGRYDGRRDFTVELQTFFEAVNGPKTIGSEVDEDLKGLLYKVKLWTPECFHFNQRGMAIISILLWNSMLEPDGNKTRSFREVTYKDLKCTKENTPYIFTRRNSANYYAMGHQ